MLHDALRQYIISYKRKKRKPEKSYYNLNNSRAIIYEGEYNDFYNDWTN